MNNENNEFIIPLEEIWWIYVYLIPQFLTNEGQIVSTILEYGGLIKDKRDLQNKLKQNKINISYQTISTSIKNLLEKEILKKEVNNKQTILVVNKIYIEKARQYKERILTKI